MSLNKRNCVIKKLGEICTIERGGSPRPISAYLTDSEDGVNWIKIGDAEEGAKYITSTKERIKPEGVKKSRMVHKGDFILSNSMSFGRPYILDIDGCIHDGWLVIHDKNNVFNKSYLYYYLASPNIYREFQSLAVGGVVNNLNSELVRNIQVAIPPLSEQSRIVEELDQLSNIIEKKRQQLSELDNLAQSIFYDMFGDPVTNEKGWEVKKLKDVSEIVGGSTPKTNVEEYWQGEHFWVTPAELKGGRYIERTERCISDEAINKTNLTLLPIGTVLLSSRAPIGKVCITKVPMYCNQGFKNVVCSNLLNNEYICQLLMIEKDYLQSLGTGATFKEISKKITEGIEIPLPPLSLQQLFAQKIEAIEKEKVLIKQSIKETEELFNSRMDCYFS